MALLGDPRERAATLAEVVELLDRYAEEWDHIESARQALSAAREEVEAMRQATENRLVPPRPRACTCTVLLQDLGFHAPGCPRSVP